MASVQATAGDPEATCQPGGNPKARVEGPGRRGFAPRRPLSLAALDAALSATCEHDVRSDRLARDDRVYRALVRRAIALGAFSWHTTYAEIARGAGYDVPPLTSRPNRRQARSQRVSTVYRALRSLEAAGILRFGGAKRDDGRWRCLEVQLLGPAFCLRPPAGRSRRCPKRRPGGRISFLRRSGTSLAVDRSNNAADRVRRRARAREGPPIEAGYGGGAASDALRMVLAANRASGAPVPWPTERFDLRQPQLAALVDLFERMREDVDGEDARFSFRSERHGGRLERILARFDRYAWASPPELRRYKARDANGYGPGFAHVAALLRSWHAAALRGEMRARRVRSLAYFLPRLDRESKAWRRRGRELASADQA